MVNKPGFWHSYMKHWGSRGYGSGQAYNEYMKLKGLVHKRYRMRKTDFLSMYRKYKDIPPSREYWKSLGRNRLPTEKGFVETEMNQKKKFNYVVRFKGYNSQTGEYTELYRTLTSDKYRSKNELLYGSQVIINQRRENYPITLSDIEVEAAYVRW